MIVFVLIDQKKQTNDLFKQTLFFSRQTKWDPAGVCELRGLLLPARGDDEERDPGSGKMTSSQSEAGISLADQ